jgi:hypothetical protein
MNKDIYLKLRKESFNIATEVKDVNLVEELNEDIISEIWYRQEFDRRDLQTIDFKKIIVLSPGEKTTSSVVDFINAKINVDGKIYIGDVEIHKNRSDWFKHKHFQQKGYENIILHVFYNYDTKKSITQNNNIFEICLKDRINLESLYINNEKILSEKFFIEPKCGKIVQPRDYLFIEELLSTAAEVRLCLKSEQYNRLFLTKQAEEQILYEKICEVYGYLNNRDNFLGLSRLVPIKKLRKIVSEYPKSFREEVIESIYFGLSGLLNDDEIQDFSNEKYPVKLYMLWKQHKSKFSRKLNKHQWRFYKTRPINYPYRRIAALSRTISNFVEFSIPTILCNFLKNFDENEVINHLMNIFYQPAAGFFAKMCSFTSKPLQKEYPLFGEERVGTIIINVVFPYWIYYTRKQKNLQLYKKVLSIYDKLKLKEKNSLVEQFVKKIIFYPEYRKYFLSYPKFTQGLIQIYKDFCKPVRHNCNNCYLVRILSNPNLYKKEDFDIVEL